MTLSEIQICINLISSKMTGEILGIGGDKIDSSRVLYSVGDKN